MTPGANPKIVICKASLLKMYNTTDSQASFKTKAKNCLQGTVINAAAV
jgi:hypothetical protein